MVVRIGECGACSHSNSESLRSERSKLLSKLVTGRYQRRQIARTLEMEQKPLDRPADHGVEHLGGDFGGRLQDESAKRQPGMGQREHVRFAHGVAVEQYVDVECAWGPALDALSTVM